MNRYDKGDKRYFPEKGKEGPKVVACLLHPFKGAIMFHEAREIDGVAVVRYGLCAMCEVALKKDPGFAKHVDKEICLRLKTLEPLEGQNV